MNPDSLNPDQNPLIALLERVIRMETKLDTALALSKDYEDRLRALERWKYGIPASLFMALVPIVALILNNWK